jgi:hypothetical protein
MDGVDEVNSENGLVIPARLRGAPALRAHVTLVLGLAFCALAFWFELKRALGGNGLSWAYVFEWPLLGAFAVYMWWNVLHPDREKNRKHKDDKKLVAPEFNSMLVAWEERQRDLAAAQEAHDQSLNAHDDAST